MLIDGAVHVGAIEHATDAEHEAVDLIVAAELPAARKSRNRLRAEIAVDQGHPGYSRNHPIGVVGMGIDPSSADIPADVATGPAERRHYHGRRPVDWRCWWRQVGRHDGASGECYECNSAQTELSHSSPPTTPMQRARARKSRVRLIGPLLHRPQ